MLGQVIDEFGCLKVGCLAGLGAITGLWEEGVAQAAYEQEDVVGAGMELEVANNFLSGKQGIPCLLGKIEGLVNTRFFKSIPSNRDP